MRPLELAVVVLGALVLTAPANWAVRALLGRIGAIDANADPGVGRWIGILERLLVFAFIVAGEAAAAALVVAAKSILRFPEISGDEPALRAEYVLVGSLASWLVAVVVGLAVAAVP